MNADPFPAVWNFGNSSQNFENEQKEQKIILFCFIKHTCFGVKPWSLLMVQCWDKSFKLQTYEYTSIRLIKYEC